VYELSGRLDEAEALYRRAVELGALRAHVRLGWFLRDARQDMAAAEGEFRLAWDNDEAGWGYELGSLLRDDGRTDEAVDVLRYASSWGDQDARELLNMITTAGTS
jgi:tetratricopeptide (TPR) repeat protein